MTCDSLACLPPLFANSFPLIIRLEEISTAASEMDISNIQVKTIVNEIFLLREDCEKAATALEEDGCILLKGSTTLDMCQEAMNRWYQLRGHELCRNEHGALGAESIMEGITKEVTLNTVFHLLCFSEKQLTHPRGYRASAFFEIQIILSLSADGNGSLGSGYSI